MSLPRPKGKDKGVDGWRGGLEVDVEGEIYQRERDDEVK